VRSLDELQPQTKRLLLLLDEMVSKQCQQLKMERSDFHFSRREVRQYTAWGDSVLKKHLHRLEELEYLIVHRGGRGQSFVYELYFERDSESGKPVLPGSCYYDEKKSRLGGGWTPSSHRQVAGVARGGHGEESPALARRNGDFRANPGKITIPAAEENHVVRTVSGVR
jgi:DNA primase